MLGIQNVMNLLVFGTHGWGCPTLQSNRCASHFCTEKLTVSGLQELSSMVYRRTQKLGMQNEEINLVAGTAKKLSFKSIFFKWEISILMGKKRQFHRNSSDILFYKQQFSLLADGWRKSFQILSKIWEFLKKSLS